MTSPHNVHASVVAFGADGGVLITGPSGSGKSALALALIDQGAQLVADDQVFVHARDGALFARTPPTIAGMIEVRGLGLLKMPYRGLARVRLCIAMGQGQAARLPKETIQPFCDVDLPYLTGQAGLSFAIGVRSLVETMRKKGSKT